MSMTLIRKHYEDVWKNKKNCYGDIVFQANHLSYQIFNDSGENSLMEHIIINGRTHETT